MNSTQAPPEVEAHTYTLDTDMAREGSGGGFDFINETGAYEGKIIEAKAIVAKTGTQGITLKFESNEGKLANYLTLYTINANGDTIYGQKQLNALMVHGKYVLPPQPLASLLNDKKLDIQAIKSYKGRSIHPVKDYSCSSTKSTFAQNPQITTTVPVKYSGTPLPWGVSPGGRNTVLYCSMARTMDSPAELFLCGLKVCCP